MGKSLAQKYKSCGRLHFDKLFQTNNLELCLDRYNYALPWRRNFLDKDGNTVLFAQVDKFGEICGYARILHKDKLWIKDCQLPRGKFNETWSRTLSEDDIGTHEIY